MNNIKFRDNISIENQTFIIANVNHRAVLIATNIGMVNHLDSKYSLPIQPEYSVDEFLIAFGLKEKYPFISIFDPDLETYVPLEYFEKRRTLYQCRVGDPFVLTPKAESDVYVIMDVNGLSINGVPVRKGNKLFIMESNKVVYLIE